MYVSKADIEKAKHMDLLTYLANYDPNNLVKETNNSYCTKEHDSLKISNGLWYWFSRGIGGRSALDYLIKVKGYSLPEAVGIINGQVVAKSPVFYSHKKQKVLQLPDIAENNDKAFNYLLKRGIDMDLINYCFERNLIMESGRYHNVMFLGYDEQGNIKYVNLRGTGSNFKGESDGSDKRYAFKIAEKKDTDVLHLFESAIDLLSFITIKIMQDKEWSQDAYLSLAGVHSKCIKVPVSVENLLKNNKQIKTICLHFDNDKIGKEATANLTGLLQGKYKVVVQTPKHGKDVNDELKYLKHNRNLQEVKKQ